MVGNGLKSRCGGCAGEGEELERCADEGGDADEGGNGAGFLERVVRISV